MSTRIVIGSTVITAPSSGTDSNWAPAMTQFMVAVQDQLSSIASQFDISPRVQILTNDANTNLDVSSVVFPSGSVLSFIFTYSVYRTNGVISLAEDGVVSGVFDASTSMWVLDHNYQGERQSDGTSYHTFNMSGDQLQISTVALGGVYDGVNSKLSYGAKTILASDI